MIMEKIILVPVGGLANRMRAVASAVTLTYRGESWKYYGSVIGD